LVIAEFNATWETSEAYKRKGFDRWEAFKTRSQPGLGTPAHQGWKEEIFELCFQTVLSGLPAALWRRGNPFRRKDCQYVKRVELGERREDCLRPIATPKWICLVMNVQYGRFEVSKHLDGPCVYRHDDSSNKSSRNYCAAHCRCSSRAGQLPALF
jgi:hypothetical protein